MKQPVLFWVTDQRNHPPRKLKLDLINNGCEIVEAGIEEWSRHVKEPGPDLAILWCSLDGEAHFLGTAQEIRQFSPRTPIIFVVSKSSEELAIAAPKAGINDYLVRK